MSKKKQTPEQTLKSKVINLLREYIDKDEEDISTGLSEGIYDKEDNEGYEDRFAAMRNMVSDFEQEKLVVILECGGGVIHNIISSAEVRVINLDDDIFRGGNARDGDNFDSRYYDGVNVIEDAGKFKKRLEGLKKEWDIEHKKAIAPHRRIK